MNNPFAENFHLYPTENDPVLNYFKDYFDSIFITFNPFSKLSDYKIENFKRENIVNEKINYIKGKIFDKNRLEKYPYLEESLCDIEDYFFTKKIYWKEILSLTGIENYKDLNKALMTSIGALKKELAEKELSQKLIKYSNTYRFWLPGEGSYDTLSKIDIFNCLIENKLYSINVIEEFYESSKKLDLRNITELEFIKTIEFKDYYIFSENKEILFTIDWDYFFFFICIDSKKISKESIEKKFDGFWANSEDSHLWDWEKGEIERKLNFK